MKTVLITGATGFLGSHLLRYLHAHTRFRFVVLKRTFSSTGRISALLQSARIRYYDVDVVTVGEVFSSNHIDIVIHCATRYGREGEKNSSCYNILETNLMFPVSILEAASAAGTQLFINTDSYFNKDGLSYTHLLNYSLSKRSLALWLKFFSGKMKVVNMMLEHIFGEDDSMSKFVPKLFDAIMIKQCLSVDLTPGEQRRDFIYVEDVCEAYKIVILYSLRSKFRFRQFDIGTGNAISIRELANIMKRISRSQTELRFGAIPYRRDEIMLSEADPIELEGIGFCPKFTVERALRKMYRKGRTAEMVW